VSVSVNQDEGSAHLRDVDSLSTSLNNWRKEQASNLELISQRVPNANREYIQKLQQILPKVNNQEAVDQYAAIMHKLGWGEYLSDFGKSFEVLKELYAVVKLREELRK
jgi:acyl-CoA synthetase (NDP forming)